MCMSMPPLSVTMIDDEHVARKARQNAAPTILRLVPKPRPAPSPAPKVPLPKDDADAVL